MSKVNCPTCKNPTNINFSQKKLLEWKHERYQYRQTIDSLAKRISRLHNEYKKKESEIAKLDMIYKKLRTEIHGIVNEIKEKSKQIKL